MIQIQIQLKQESEKLGVSIDMLGSEDNTPEEILSGNAILEGIKLLLEELVKNAD